MIGRIGNSGVQSGNPHLHHEVLLSTRCSLEFALDNPSSICNTLGVDPLVHPLYVYPRNVTGTTSSITITLQQNATSSHDGAIRVSADYADLNRFEVKIRNTQDRTIRKYHVLNKNVRIGINPNSTTELNAIDTAKPYLKPTSSSFADGGYAGDDDDDEYTKEW